MVSADSGFHGGGGAGNRGEYYTSTRSEPDTSAKVSSMFGIDWTDENDRSNLFHYCLGLAGAVFSDDTTVKSVYNQFRAIYGSDDPDTIEKIFYVGKDGQLYFTDDFLSQFRAIVDENSFHQGVFSIPLCSDDSVVHEYFNIGALYLTNSITNALQGNSVLLIPSLYQASFGAGYGRSFSTGLDVSSYSYIFPFQSFNAYRSFCNTSLPSSGQYSVCFYPDSSCASTIVPFNQFSSTQSSSGFASMSDVNVRLAPLATDFSTSDFLSASVCNRHTTERGSCRAFYLFGVGTVEAYSDVEHFKFYSSGGTGVIRANTYYAFDNKQDADNIMGRDWKKYYQGLQYAYKDLAKGVAAGNKTLKEVNQTLSDEILGTVADISQDVAQQTNYLKKILDEIKSISGKLTYSNVVETVSAASNLLSAVCDVLDSLFSSDDGVFSLLDFVETYVLDGTGKTIASVMQTVFPFSLPHDFYLILELLSVNPETPQVHFKFDLARLGMSYDYSYTANDFEKLAYMTRFFSSVGFVLLLINFTNKILKK